MPRAKRCPDHSYFVAECEHCNQRHAWELDRRFIPDYFYEYHPMLWEDFSEPDTPPPSLDPAATSYCAARLRRNECPCTLSAGCRLYALAQARAKRRTLERLVEDPLRRG
jgi:hypothetical protein